MRKFLRTITLILCAMMFMAQGVMASTIDAVVSGTTATITVTGDEFFNLGDENTAKQQFGEEVWNQIKACENLVFVGKFGSLDAFNNGVSVAKSVDFSDAQFGVTEETIQVKIKDGYYDAVNGVWVPEQYESQVVKSSTLKFTYWANTIEEAITPAEPNLSTPIYSDIHIKKNAFEGCSKLKKVVFNAGVVEGVADNSGNCPDFEEVIFNEGVTEITAKAFKSFFKENTNCKMQDLVLPSTLTKVGEQAFFECSCFESVTMNDLNGSCDFGKEVFGSCFSLKHVTLSEGVTGISEQMFDKCGMLESVRIPTTCKTIGDKAFNICAALHTIIIPEGVERIGQNVFENSGLTDIYVMAKSAATVPQIYSIGESWGGNGGTFTSGQETSNSADPSAAHQGDIATASEDEILSWYQDDMSDGRLGIGGGNCMVRLHYPKEMRFFYDGIANPLTGQTDWAHTQDRLTESVLTEKQNAWDSYISEAYAGGDNQYPAFGPDANENYWPTGTDYLLRLQAGYPGAGNEPSSLGWRQLPLQKVADPNDYIYTKKYDDTWYTMCFPWDMDDNTLFRAFNQKCEITEFLGVELIETSAQGAEEKEYTMVFHFDDVADTYYMTEDHATDHLEYVRVKDHTVSVDGQTKNTTRTEMVQTAGGTIEKKYYTYHLVNGTDAGYEYVYWPFNLPEKKSNYSAEQKAMTERYEKILHLMVFAGHPYMIHPSIGAKPTKPADCTFAGVRKISAGDNVALEKLASDNKVTKVATTDGTAYHNPGQTPFVNPTTGKGGSYTFIGNINDYDENAEVKAKDMLSTEYPVAYFLGVEAGQMYPKYYRKSTGGVNKWSQYSAIIRPESDARANIENFVKTNVGNTGNAKAFDVEFGEWEVVDVTAIKDIIADAEQKGQPVQKAHLNVVFNIKGQVVREGTPTVEGLPAGLYIVNGKKYMVK